MHLCPNFWLRDWEIGLECIVNGNFEYNDAIM